MAILACVIFNVIVGGSGYLKISIYASTIFNLLLFGPLNLGISSCFLKLIRDKSFNIEDLFDGFKSFIPALVLHLLSSLFILLWGLLLVIPGIIAYYRYSMSYYIMLDNPELGVMEVLNASKEMMIGYKAKLFGLHLSFIGWGILCIFTIGIGFLWLGPYMEASNASFYQSLKALTIESTIE